MVHRKMRWHLSCCLLPVSFVNQSFTGSWNMLNERFSNILDKDTLKWPTNKLFIQTDCIIGLNSKPMHE